MRNYNILLFISGYLAKQYICVFIIVWQKYPDATNLLKILHGHYSKMAAKELKFQFPWFLSYLANYINNNNNIDCLISYDDTRKYCMVIVSVQDKHFCDFKLSHFRHFTTCPAFAIDTDIQYYGRTCPNAYMTTVHIVLLAISNYMLFHRHNHHNVIVRFTKYCFNAWSFLIASSMYSLFLLKVWKLPEVILLDDK